MACIRIKFFFVALTIGLFASGLLAQVATVESSNGLLRVRNANQTAPMPIGVGQTLAEGAEVSTEPGGVGVLRFADGQKLALASNSSVRRPFWSPMAKMFPPANYYAAWAKPWAARRV